MSDRLAWLHGWGRLGDDGIQVLMGTGVHCVGCGVSHGVTTVVIPDDWEPPTLEPEWPFPEGDCPVCALLAVVERNPPGPTWPKGKPRPLP